MYIPANRFPGILSNPLYVSATGNVRALNIAYVNDLCSKVYVLNFVSVLNYAKIPILMRFVALIPIRRMINTIDILCICLCMFC